MRSGPETMTVFRMLPAAEHRGMRPDFSPFQMIIFAGARPSPRSMKMETDHEPLPAEKIS